MPRRPGYAPALAAAACALLAASYSVPAASAGLRLPSAPAAASATISAGTAPLFTALAFPAASAGWVLGQTTTGPPRAQVWHTGTQGSTWQMQWQGRGSPLAITAADRAHAWALIACPAHQGCGRELLATADGGRQWGVIATLPKAVNQVQFYSRTLGLATSDSCLADLSLTHCPGQVLASRDGGAHWAPVLSGAGPEFATASPTGQLWAAEVFPSSFAASGPGPSDVKFVTSTDGGRTWHLLGHLRNLGPLSPEVQVTLAPDSSGLAWASVFDQLSCAMHGCTAAELLQSGDGGRTWSAANLPDNYPDECASDNIVFSPVPSGGAWAATGRNGAACAPPYGLLYRFPGPVNPWQELPPWQLAQVSALAAVTGREAWAIGDGVVSVTFDGGALWTQVLPAPSPTGLVEAVTGTAALAAQDTANAGAVLRSDDGGRRWNQIAQLPGVVTQLDFWSASNGVAATYSPDVSPPWQLFVTSDGGSIWAPYGTLPGGNTAIDGPWISANGHGLLLTVTGATPWLPGTVANPPVRIWTTSNGGLNWTRGAVLPLGADTLQGGVSFAPYAGSDPLPRWSGWLVIATASFAQRVAVTSGGPLQLLPAATPAGFVQLVSPGTGFAWDLQYPGGATLVVLSLARTTDGGRTWQRSSIRIQIPVNSAATPLLDFSDANHGWLVIGTATWRTADGGRTWARAQPRRGNHGATRDGCPCFAAGQPTDLVHAPPGRPRPAQLGLSGA